MLRGSGGSSPVLLGPLPGRRASAAVGVVDVLAGGIGVANAAAGASAALGTHRYNLVLCAGIAGGFGVPAGTVVVADVVVHADLGAQDGPDFRSVSELGLGRDRFELDGATTAELARRSSARTGTVLTVSTVSGSADTAAQHLRRRRDALAEAMEGAGVLAAAQLFGVGFGEVRAISNAVGPRDRSAWQIPRALDALSSAFTGILAEGWPA